MILQKIKKKPYALLLASAVMAIVLLAILAYGMFGALLRTSARTGAAKQEAAFMQLQAVQLDDFKFRYPELQENLDKISGLFVDGSNPVDFITFLEGISRGANVQSEVSISPAAGKEGATQARNMMFLISLRGDFSDILDFSEKLEAAPYLVKVNSFKVARVQKNTLDAAESLGAQEAYLVVGALPK